MRGPKDLRKSTINGPLCDVRSVDWSAPQTSAEIYTSYCAVWWRVLFISASVILSRQARVVPETCPIKHIQKSVWSEKLKRFTCYSTYMYCQGQAKVWRCGGLTCSKPVLLKPQREILSAPALMLLMHLLSSPEACGKACWDVSGRFSQCRPPSFQAVRSSIYSPRLVQRLCNSRTALDWKPY